MKFSALDWIQYTDKRHLKYQKLSFSHIDGISVRFSVRGQSDEASV